MSRFKFIKAGGREADKPKRASALAVPDAKMIRSHCAVRWLEEGLGTRLLSRVNERVHLLKRGLGKSQGRKALPKSVSVLIVPNAKMNHPVLLADEREHMQKCELSRGPRRRSFISRASALPVLNDPLCFSLSFGGLRVAVTS